MQADRMAALGSLAARVGHEMNNPLAFMMANLSFAREEMDRLQRVAARTEARTVTPELDEVLEALGETPGGRGPAEAHRPGSAHCSRASRPSTGRGWRCTRCWRTR